MNDWANCFKFREQFQQFSNTTNYNNHYNTTPATISAPISRDSNSLEIIHFNCAQNTGFTDFEATLSLAETLIHVKDVVYLNLKKQGFNGSLHDIVLRTIDKKELGIQTKTLKDILHILIEQKISVYLLNNDYQRRESESKSSRADLESKDSLTSLDSGVSSQSSSDLTEASPRSRRKRIQSFTIERNASDPYSDRIKTKLEKIMTNLYQTQSLLGNVRQPVLHLKNLFNVAYHELTECVNIAKRYQSVFLFKELSETYCKFYELEAKLNQCKGVSPFDIVTEAYEIMKDIESAYL